MSSERRTPDPVRRRTGDPAQQAMLLELSLEPILVWELYGPITYWNAGAASLYGYSAAEAIGRRSHDLLATVLVVPDEPLDVMVERDGRWMGELIHTTRDGRKVIVESRQELVRRPGGLAPLVLETNRDVTARKEAEAQLREAKEAAERANATKSRFLAAASHDLRQPLQALDLQRTILARTVTEPEALRTVQELGRSIDAMRGTLDALLDLYQLESGTVAPRLAEFALDELLQGVAGEFHGLAAAKGLRFRVVPTSAIVCSDRRLLERILRNLVANAVKYTQTGKILLGCRSLRQDRLAVQVWDTGIGIAAHARDSVFEEFYQIGNPSRDRQFGLGLGLAIARVSADLVGSRISVRSVPGKGSMFAVEVRSTGRARSPRLRPRQWPGGAATDTASILLVEDEPAIRGALRTLLGLDGHRVTVAATGGVALAMVEGGACRPAMVIVDQNLPGELTGVEAVLRLRELARPRHLPALVITGDVLPERLAAITRAGLPHLTKPVDVRELRALIRTLLGEGQATAGNGRAPAGGLDRLTARERAVVDLVASGLPSRQISVRLGISARTVEGHRAQAMRKLGVRSLAELLHLLVARQPDRP